MRCGSPANAHAFRRRALVLVVAFSALLGAASQARAATFTVGTKSDDSSAGCIPSSGSCSLRQLIQYENASPSGASDTIVVPAGTYELSGGALTITHSASIAGAGASTTSVVQGSMPAARVFVVQPSGTTPTVSIYGLTISGGSSTDSFGGDVLNRAALTLSGDWITDGAAPSGSGGGVSNEGGTLTLTHSLVSGNSSTGGQGEGGGIENYGDSTAGPARLEIDNSTITANTAGLGGGVVSRCVGSCSPSGASNTASITGSTIAENDGGSAGGGLLATQGTISIGGSIVADNIATSGPNCDGGGVASLGYNLESGTDCGFTSTGDLQNGNPQFSSTSPQGNGGATGTFALALSSPAIDHVPSGVDGCGGTDQRGVARPQGSACDIGAFEFVQPEAGSPLSGAITVAPCAVTGTPAINWGDDTSSAGTYSPQSGAISGTHTYGQAGTYAIAVSWAGSCPYNSSTVTVHVPDAPFTMVASSLTLTAGVLLDGGTLATLTDANSDAVASDFSTTIGWGDGKTSRGVLVPLARGFAVTGSHVYGHAGSYQTTISVSDIGGFSGSIHGLATVRSAPAPGAVRVTVGGSTVARLSGLVAPEGLRTTAQFVYGLAKRYRTPGFHGSVYDHSTSAVLLGSGYGMSALSATVSGLVPNALYDVRLVATNAAGTTQGPARTFTTRSDPPPPAPALDRTVDLVPSGGLVLVLVRGGPLPLTEARQFPLGTVLDTLNGSVKWSPARDRWPRQAGQWHIRRRGVRDHAVPRTHDAVAGGRKGRRSQLCELSGQGRGALPEP